MPPTRAELFARLAELTLGLGQAPLAPAMSDALVAYVELVASWNHRVDLTGAKSATDLVEVLLADALIMADAELVPADARVVDVGTGVGAPIIPLLLLRAETRALCFEPRRKRVAFLRTAIGQLGLVERLAVREGRLQPDATEAPPMLLGESSPTLSCSRATFSPETWLPTGLSLAPRCMVFAAREGLPQVPEGASLIAQRSYSLPSSKAPRILGVYVRG